MAAQPRRAHVIRAVGSSACWAALLRQEHGREVTSVLCVHVIDPETDPCNPTRLVGREKDCIVGTGIIAGLVLCRTPRVERRALVITSLQFHFTHLNRGLNVRVVRNVTDNRLWCGPQDCWNASTESKRKWPIARYVGGDPGCPPPSPCSTDAPFRAAPSFCWTIGMCLFRSYGMSNLLPVVLG